MTVQVDKIKKTGQVDGSSSGSTITRESEYDKLQKTDIFSYARKNGNSFSSNNQNPPTQAKKEGGKNLLQKVFHADKETKGQDNECKTGSTNANRLIDRFKELADKLKLTEIQTEKKIADSNKKIEKLDKENEKISKEIEQKTSEETGEDNKTQEGPDSNDAGNTDATNSNSTGNSNNNTSNSSSKESGNNSEVKALQNKLTSNTKQINNTEKGQRAYINNLTKQASMFKKAATAGASDAVNGNKGADTASKIGGGTATVGGLASATGATLMAIPSVEPTTKILGGKLMLGGSAATVAGTGTQAIASMSKKDWEGAANSATVAANTAAGTIDKSDKLNKLIKENKQTNAGGSGSIS